MDRIALRNTLIGVFAPFAVCVALVPWRERLANTDVSLVLVLVIVAVAALGSRVAGVVAALSAAAWFDFFLTRPYEQFVITAGADVKTTVLLVMVGAVVTEIAHWGRRQHARAGRQSGYLDGLQLAANAVAGGRASTNELVERAGEQVTGMLGVTSCRFEPGEGRTGRPRLEPDGRLVWGENVWDVDHLGLPVQAETEVPAICRGRVMGRFLLTAAPDTRPPVERRRLAVAMATLVGFALVGAPESARPVVPSFLREPTRLSDPMR